MNLPDNQPVMPEVLNKENGEPRRVGVEIEFSGMDLQGIATVITHHFGGDITNKHRFVAVVATADYGEFKIELDAELLKKIGQTMAEEGEETSLTKASLDIVEVTASQLVPWEIVSPPLEFKALEKLVGVIDDLRSNGAKGTRDSLANAFGVHLNPEIPDISAKTVLSYLRAYLLLHDWMTEKENPDVMRRITPYINGFDDKYAELVVAEDYHPDMNALIDDYLAYNPTRNRALDMLPLFAHIDEQRVRSVVDDPRIQARPTFHFRLPNTDLTDPDWNIDVPWNLWLAVEYVANHADLLSHLSSAYIRHCTSVFGWSKARWANYVDQKLPDFNS